jgi:hypothetical protein
MKELLGTDLDIAVEMDFDCTAREFLNLLSPDSSLLAATPTRDDLPDYDGPEVDLPDLSWADNVLA